MTSGSQVLNNLPKKKRNKRGYRFLRRTVSSKKKRLRYTVFLYLKNKFYKSFCCDELE